MNEELPSLDLAVATHRPEGIERVAKLLLPPAQGVTYIVSWQDHRDAPIPAELAAREDVKIFRFDETGQSLNRNNAIEHCQGDIILHSDDDLIYYPDGLAGLRRIFRDNPELALATFRSAHGDMSRFPDEAVKLTPKKLPKGYSVACFEMAFRRTSAPWLRFCPELGLGSERFHGGEDEAFLFTAINRGLDCRFFPVTICAHPHDSTGTKASVTDKNLLASGCIIALQYPRSAALRVPLKAWRLSRQGKASLFRALKHLTQGALAAPGLRRRNKKFLW